MSNATETKRGPGRPSNFPGQKTIAVITKLPVDVKEQVEALAERREEPLGVTIDRLLRRGLADANRSRKS